MGRRPKLPSYQFYPGDWMKDTALRACSLAARGLWQDMLCLMFESERRGFLQLNGNPMTPTQIANAVGAPAEEVTRCLQELENAGVCSANRHGIIFSRRLVRDESLRSERSKAGRAGGLAAYSKRSANGTAKPSSSSSSSFSTSVLNTSCSEPEKSGSEQQPVLVFPIVPKARGEPAEWSLMQVKLAEYQESFPGLDVMAHLRAARQWCLDNGKNRKTASGMGRFLTNWLTKEQNRGAGGRNGRPAPLFEHKARPLTDEEIDRLNTTGAL